MASPQQLAGPPASAAAMAATNGSSRLLSMPLEVLLHISSYLTTPEYGQLRRTCKHIEVSLFKAFAKEFFSKRQFILTEFSLQTLVDISKSRLGPSLKYLIIGLQKPAARSASVWLYGPQNNTHTTSAERGLRKNALTAEIMSHRSLTSSGRDFDLLREALQNLLDLRTIGIRDYYAAGRSRDGPRALWRSYGAAKFGHDTGGFELESPRRSHTLDADMNGYIHHVFLTILRAIGSTSSTRPEAFEAILRHCGLPDATFNIAPYLDPVIQPVLANLKTVFLDLATTSLPITIQDPCTEDGAISCETFHLQGFLSKMKKLEHLRINFSGIGHAVICDIVSWLAKRPRDDAAASTPQPPPTLSPSSLPQAPSPVSFAHLRELDIGHGTVDKDVLLGALRAYKSTLRKVCFHRLALLVPANQSEEQVNLWSKLFSQMAKSSLSLTSIHLSQLSQEHGGSWHNPSVLFRSPGIYPLQKDKKWSGHDLDRALKDLVDTIMIEWPPQQDTPDSDMEVDEAETVDSESDDNDDPADAVALPHPPGHGPTPALNPAILNHVMNMAFNNTTNDDDGNDNLGL